MCICASWLPMPRLPECSTTHTRARSSRHSSKKWLPEPSVPNCLAAFAVCWSATARSPAGARASHSSALRAATSWPWPTPAGIACSMRPSSGSSVVGQLVLGDVELGGDHAAADVDADRGRDHRAPGRDHRADGRADADVGVGHEGDVALDDRQARRLLGLADGPGSMSLAQEMSLSLTWVGMSPPFGCWLVWSTGVGPASRAWCARILAVGCGRAERTPAAGLRARRRVRWTSAAGWKGDGTRTHKGRGSFPRGATDGTCTRDLRLDGPALLLAELRRLAGASWASNPVSSGVRARCPTCQAGRAWWAGRESNPLCPKTAGLQPAAPHGATDPCRSHVAMASTAMSLQLSRCLWPDWLPGAGAGSEGVEPPAVGVGDRGATTGSSPKGGKRA